MYITETVPQEWTSRRRDGPVLAVVRAITGSPRRRVTRSFRDDTREYYGVGTVSAAGTTGCAAITLFPSTLLSWSMSDTDTVDIEIENDEEEMADDIDAESVDPGVAADVDEDEGEQEEETFERERAVAFDEAAETLAETFDIDARKGETIDELSTVETEDGRQLVATVEKHRRTAFAARLSDARRTGRRVGTVALLLGIVAVGLSALRRARSGDDDGLDVDPIDEDDVDI
jgi:hypothetical protein